MTPRILQTCAAALLASTALTATSAQADQVFTDDVIIQGSLCVGQDCVNGESFSFDTIRLKENNVRIKFDDTSTSGSFPNNDWQLTANDSSNGGANKFSIDDITGGRTPFTIEANAPSNSLYVDDSGRVGFGTGTPAVEAHVVDGDSPTLRLEQNGSSGFTPYTWDVAGNETNFFVRDVTNGSQLPFKIKPGANTNALFVAANNRIGLLTDNPSAALHIRRDDGTAALLVEELSTTEAARGLLTLKNNGGMFITFDNTAAGASDWFMTAENNIPRRFNIVSSGGPSNGLFLSEDGTFQVGGNGTAGNGMLLDASGNLAIGGSLTQNSDKNAKMAIEPVDAEEILAKVSALEVSEWTYIADEATGVRHIGPMAQDFYALFGTGATDKGISVTDSAGVALAAIQALEARLSAQAAEMEALKAELATLKQ